MMQNSSERFTQMIKPITLSNSGFELEATVNNGQPRLRLTEQATQTLCSDGDYHWSLVLPHEAGQLDCTRPGDVTFELQEQALRFSTTLGGLQLTHRWALPVDVPWMQETLSLTNPTDKPIQVNQIECGFLRRIADPIGNLTDGAKDERVAAVPFRKRPSDEAGWLNDHALDDLLLLAGREPRCDDMLGFGFLPSRHWCSEAWAWTRGDQTLALMSFCQEHMLLSTLSTFTKPDGLWLRFGGFYLQDQDDNPALTLAPGATVELGVMRYESISGGYQDAAYAYRDFLDAQGCRFPAGFNPPVHWNEIYDNPDWWVVSPGEMPRGSRINTRHTLFTPADMEREAEKARAYHCESLYLDPGWDTTFGSFQWDAERLGPPADFVNHMRNTYNLGVSLHAPLATWMSHGEWSAQPWDTVKYWPEDARRLTPEAANGQPPTDPAAKAQICLGSKQYLDEAEKRLLKMCEAGVVFIMFDGNWWNGGCNNPDHGHPVPYTREDHIRANLDLAQRIHAHYPDVLIEMHDMLCGGAHPRMTPVYYKYGLPGSYDSNWGFELMWNPMEELRSGRALALYYYNLACNIPIYLHIDLRDDNANCSIFWWFASLCRHLGIGGTHADPNIAAAQRHGMARYRELDALYKHGDFYGISEDIHVHVLPQDNRLVVDLFNLTDQEREVTGSMPAERLNIAMDCYYQRSERWASLGHGQLHAGCTLPAWGHQQVELRAIAQ